MGDKIRESIGKAMLGFQKIDDAIRVCLAGLGHHPELISGRLTLAKAFIQKEDFDALIDTRPTIALEMMRELSRRLVTTTRRKRQLARRRITAPRRRQ